jgi:toxin ParE1/3/4
MRALQYSLEAAADLAEIGFYIYFDNPPAADKVTSHIEQQCQMLTVFPKMGTQCDDLGPGYRCLVVESYVVIYEILPDIIKILRIVSGYRDRQALFGGEGDLE